MNEMIERVGIAITKASKDLRSTYGVFDYSSYGKIVKPNVVRDFTNRSNQNIGEFDTSEEANEFYIKTCETYVAKAAIKAMREPTQEMVDAALATQDIYTGRGSLARIGYQAMIDEILK